MPQAAEPGTRSRRGRCRRCSSAGWRSWADSLWDSTATRRTSSSGSLNSSSARAWSTAMVGLLTALPQTRLWQRLKQRGPAGSGKQRQQHAGGAEFQTPSSTAISSTDGYRELMKKLYEPQVLLPADSHVSEEPPAQRPAAPAVTGGFPGVREILLAAGDLVSRPRGLLEVFPGAHLLRRPRQFRQGIELAIIGYHFRRVAGLL